jgi:hypothetical protein
MGSAGEPKSAATGYFLSILLLYAALISGIALIISAAMNLLKSLKK